MLEHLLYSIITENTIIHSKNLSIMKKSLKLTALLLAATILFTSCIGSFRLSSKVLAWNKGVGDKWVNELVFLALNIIPVYPLASFADILVLNSIEFWTGTHPLAEEGATKTIKNAQGEAIQVTTNENGYTLSNGEKAVNLVYNENEQAWSAEAHGQSANLVKLNDDNTASLYVGDEVVAVSLDAEGLNAAYALVGYAAN